MKKKIVLAYSGGLDTSVILKWLILEGYEVVACTADVGQREDFEAVKAKALMLGASDLYIADLKDSFVNEFIFKALKAQAIYEGRYLLGTALARPLIAKALVECAHTEQASTIAHGATGKGNDQIRFELGARALDSSLHILAPWREKNFLDRFQGRECLIAFAKEQGIPISSTLQKPYSIDDNLMHISYEGGSLENPATTPLPGTFKWTKDLQETPDISTEITLIFERGIPIRLFNHSTNVYVEGSLPLFQALNAVGAENGIGRIDIVENRFLGMKSRGIYETPGATILWKAHHDLECFTLDREVLHLKQSFSSQIARLIYNGLWYSPEMAFLMEAIEHSQQSVNGEVTLQLYKGSVMILHRSSATSVYNPLLASMNESASFNSQDATGFINCLGVRLCR